MCTDNGGVCVERFEGVISALPVPFHENGEIHWHNLDKWCDYQFQNGVSGLVVGGTTGESPTLHHEQEMINRRVIKLLARTELPVIVGAGDYDTRTAVERTLRAFDAGAHATLHVMGYYNKPPQRGVMDYFDRVAQAALLPVIMYNIPPRGAAEYKPQTMIELAMRHENIIGVKEASGAPAVDVAKETRRLAAEAGMDRHRFKILSGDDDKTYGLMVDPAIKGVGVISVMGNLLPHAYAELVDHLFRGDVTSAGDVNLRLAPLNGMVGVTVHDDAIGSTDTFRNPAPVKAAAYLLGMIQNPTVRSPLVELPGAGYEEVGKRLAAVYATSPEWFKPIEKFYGVDVGTRLAPYRAA